MPELKENALNGKPTYNGLYNLATYQSIGRCAMLERWIASTPTTAKVTRISSILVKLAGKNLLVRSDREKITTQARGAISRRINILIRFRRGDSDDEGKAIAIK